jgi:hypothetical protein
MSQPAKRRNYWILIIPILVAMVYWVWFYFQPTLTGYHKVDGMLGVLLGLYIGSRAAVNFLDMLLYSRSALFQNASTKSIVIWLLANILTQVISFAVVLFALSRFFR